jgi:hypothetical protein
VGWTKAITDLGIEPSFDRAAHQRGVFRYELVVIDSGGYDRRDRDDRGVQVFHRPPTTA